MTYPRKQYVLAHTRGCKTSFFYGPKLGKLINEHIHVGDDFSYAEQITDNWRSGIRTSETCYALERTTS
jgi:hypothetical protein